MSRRARSVVMLLKIFIIVKGDIIVNISDQLFKSLISLQVKDSLSVKRQEVDVSS